MPKPPSSPVQATRWLAKARAHLIVWISTLTPPPNANAQAGANNSYMNAALLLLAVATTTTTSTHAFIVPPQSHAVARPTATRLAAFSPQTQIDDLESKLTPSLGTFLRLASTVLIGGAYFSSPIMTNAVESIVSTTTLSSLPSSSVLVADKTVMESTCLGFGCGSYNGPDYGGAPKLETGEANVDMPAFLKLVDEKKVEKVELSDGGNVAYAYIMKEGGKEGGAATTTERVRIGEGFPIENGKTWSSPLWVVRILKDKQIPYTLGFDLSGAAKMTRTVPRFF